MIWFLSLICFALPAYLIRFKIFGIPTTALEILIYIAVLVQILRSAIPSLLRRTPPDSRSAPLRSFWCPLMRDEGTASLRLSHILLPILLFFLAGAISTIISPDKRTSLGILKGWIFDPILLFGLILINVKSGEDFRKIIYGLASGAIIVSFWGIFQAFGFSYLLPHQRTDPSFLSYLATHRAFGPFESPNYLGMYLAPIAALTLGYWLKSQIPNSKSKTNSKFKIQNSYFMSHSSYFITFCLVAMLLALFFTKSLGAWFGFFVALAFLIWFYLPKEKRPAFLAFLILTILLGGTFLFKWKTQRILDSFAARKEVWCVSWYLIKEHPVLGIGLGTFPKIYNQTIASIHFPPINWLQMHPHNIFLAFWLNLGILGLFSFLWFVYLFFKKIKKCLTNYLRPYVICWTIAMVAILTHGLIDTTYWKNDLSALFWIIMGMAIINSEFKNQNAK